MNASEVIREKYEAKKINALYEHLNAMQEQGQPREYEIQIDKFPVVAKTTDLNRFMSYAEHIEPESSVVTVSLFKSNRHADKYFFYLSEEGFHKAKERDLKGLPEENKLSAMSEVELKERIRRDLHYEELIKENAYLKSQVSDLEKDLEDAYQIAENVRNEVGMTWEQRGQMMMEGIFKLPGIKGLMGGNSETLSGTPQSNESKNTEQGSFKAKNQSEETEDANCIDVSKEEKRLLATLDDVRTKLGHTAFENAMGLLNLMAPYPESVNYARKQVENYLRTKGFM